MKHPVPAVQYMEKIVRVDGGHSSVVRVLAAQARGPGFKSWQLRAFHVLLLCLKMNLYFPAEADYYVSIYIHSAVKGKCYPGESTVECYPANSCQSFMEFSIRSVCIVSCVDLNQL